ncbi:MAG: hypothetical protein HY696_09775 [Deltaproteobacteria bacterium]|nr:hypothetical protein [Deltaproteobacteria bacterium]
MRAHTWPANWTARANAVRASGRGWAIIIDGKALRPGVTCVYFDPRRQDVSAHDANTPTYSEDGRTAFLHDNHAARCYAAVFLDNARWRVAAAPNTSTPLQVEVAEEGQWQDLPPPLGALAASWDTSTGVFLAAPNTRHEVAFTLQCDGHPHYGGMIDALAPALIARYLDNVPPPDAIPLRDTVATAGSNCDAAAAGEWEQRLSSASPLRRHNMAVLAELATVDTLYFDPQHGRLLRDYLSAHGGSYYSYDYIPSDILYPKVGIWAFRAYDVREDTSPLYSGPEVTPAARAELAALAALPVLHARR